jgi:hypothetical protein
MDANIVSSFYDFSYYDFTNGRVALEVAPVWLQHLASPVANPAPESLSKNALQILAT